MGGRPSKYTPEVRKKMEEAAAMDCSIPELCLYAGITKDTYYRWIKEKDGLSDRLDELRAEPFLKARTTIVKSLDDPNHAYKYMERKLRKEFGTNIDVTSDGDKVTFTIVSYDGDTDSSQLDA